MASNSTLVAVKTRGKLDGFGNIFSKENHSWWGTWQWLIQIGIWMAIVNGMLAMVILAKPSPEAIQAKQAINEARGAATIGIISQTALTVFFLFCGLAPSVGVVIIAQDALIGEKQSGTAAWVLSKPVSRAGFILSKLSADSLGTLATMVIVQGAVAYLIYKAGTGISLAIPGYLAALGLVTLMLWFYLSFTYMLGTLFQKRGAVIGLPILLVFGNNLTGLFPWLAKVMPWNLVMALGPDKPSMAVMLAQGQPLPTITPIISTAILSVVFIAVALWRFQIEEF